MGTLPGKRARGRPKTSWMNNITAWTGLTLNVILRIEKSGELLSGVRSTLGSRKTKKKEVEGRPKSKSVE